MAASFAAASSQRLGQTTIPFPSTGYPITVGIWVFPVNTTSQVIWSLSDSSAGQYLRITKATAFAATAAAGGTDSAATIGTAFTTSTWSFICARFIATNNRKIGVVQSTAVTAHASISASRGPITMDRVTIGALGGTTPASFFDGLIGEYWVTATDIQGDGAQLQDGLLLQLAYGGPLSVPSVARDVIEYRSMIKHPTSDGDEVSENYVGHLGRQVWTNHNGVTTGHHPPLPYWYEKPGQRRRVLTI